MTDTSLIQQKQAELKSQRETILANTGNAKQLVQELQLELNRAHAERLRLQNICTNMEAQREGTPPFEQFARAVLKVDEAANQLIAAEKREAEATAEQNARLAQIEADEAELRRQILQAELSAKIVEFESAVQRSQLGRLSDEIRKMAGIAGLRLEEHSPLIDMDNLSIAGYPIKAWGAPPAAVPLV